METFSDYLAHIENPEHRARTVEVLAWVRKKFPGLAPKIAWNQPMFIDHGTFIIGFSVAKHHLAVAPEKAGMAHFAEALEQAGHARTKLLWQIGWDRPVDYALLEKMIRFNIAEKAEVNSFWRK